MFQARSMMMFPFADMRAEKESRDFRGLNPISCSLGRYAFLDAPSA